MMSFLFFLIVTGLLTIEGYYASRLILRTREKLLAVALGLPIASLLNVLLVALFTIANIPLSPLSLLSSHLALTLIFLYGNKHMKEVHEVHQSPKIEIKKQSRVLISASILLLACIVAYAFVHAVMLPTFQFDSLTNWTMRSQISFYDQRIAFDATEARGMAKPQYPFLFHALQVTVMQGQVMWIDSFANIALFLLGVSCWMSMLLLLRKMMSTGTALIVLTLVIGTPLLAVHTAQGYGDSILIQCAVLCHAATLVWIIRKNDRFLLLAGIFAAASVWSKAEGLTFVFLPWILTVSLIAWRNQSIRRVRTVLLLSLLLGLSWTTGALIAGLSLTPHHGSDTILAISLPAIREALVGLFDRGSFGIGWYAVCTVIAFLLIDTKTRPRFFSPIGMTLLIPSIAFALIFLVYTVTPNSAFLLKGESYYRQMLLPLSLFILSLAAIFFTHPDDQSDVHNPAVETRYRI
jgi:hypothetical protein